MTTIIASTFADTEGTCLGGCGTPMPPVPAYNISCAHGGCYLAQLCTAEQVPDCIRAAREGRVLARREE